MSAARVITHAEQCFVHVYVRASQIFQCNFNTQNETETKEAASRPFCFNNDRAKHCGFMLEVKTDEKHCALYIASRSAGREEPVFCGCATTWAFTPQKQSGQISFRLKWTSTTVHTPFTPVFSADSLWSNRPKRILISGVNSATHNRSTIWIWNKEIGIGNLSWIYMYWISRHYKWILFWFNKVQTGVKIKMKGFTLVMAIIRNRITKGSLLGFCVGRFWLGLDLGKIKIHMKAGECKKKCPAYTHSLRRRKC